jgi:hypothetical protein
MTDLTAAIQNKKTESSTQTDECLVYNYAWKSKLKYDV